MSSDIGFGIVGAGMVARYHARAIAETAAPTGSAAGGGVNSPGGGFSSTIATLLLPDFAGLGAFLYATWFLRGETSQ